MSLFTWKRNKKGKSKEKEKSDDLKKGDFEDADFELPPSLTRNRERNLSISRSGRHKVKKQSRTSVMSDEVYSPDSAPRSPPAWPQDSSNSKTSPTSTSHSASHQSKVAANPGASYHCRETIDPQTTNLSGSQRMARAPTAV